jgi:hypothetical protein
MGTFFMPCAFLGLSFGAQIVSPKPIPSCSATQFAFREILYCASHNANVFSQKPNTAITSVAQKTAHFLNTVLVVNIPCIVSAARFLCSAYSAALFLLAILLLYRCTVYAVSSNLHQLKAACSVLPVTQPASFSAALFDIFLSS